MNLQTSPGRQTFPDGTNMLAMMHNDNYIKKFKTNEIMVTLATLLTVESLEQVERDGCQGERQGICKRHGQLIQ